MLESLRAFQEYSELAKRTGAINLAQGVPEALLSEELDNQISTHHGSHWQYVEPEGVPDLRDAVARLYEPCFGPEDVIVTSGCTEALFVALAAAQKSTGPQVAFLEPFYPYYLGMAHSLAMHAVGVSMKRADGRAEPDWESLERYMLRGTGTFILNTPHNPTGWSIGEDEARWVGKQAERLGWSIVVDHAYFGYEYETRGHDAVTALAACCSRIAAAGSASKLLSATGLRVGWLLSRRDQFEECLGLHMCLSYCQPLLLQRCVSTMLKTLGRPPIPSIVRHYRKKRDILSVALEEYGFAAVRPEGGHFVLADYSNMAPQLTPAQFVRELQQTAGVVCLPTDPFYFVPGRREVRFSFSGSLSDILECRDRLSSRFKNGSSRWIP